MIDKDLDNVMSRIEKLLAMADDSRGNVNEAATAMSMANKLMAKYQLDHQDIITASLMRGDDLDDEMLDIPGVASKCPVWLSTLVMVIAKYNSCSVKYSTGDDGYIKFKVCGFASDVKITSWMFVYATNTINALCNKWSTESDAFNKRPKTVSAVAAKRSYKLACAQAINATLEAEMALNTGTGLVLVKAKAIEAKYGEFKYKDAKTKTYVAAAIAGQADGSKIDLARRGLDENKGNTDTVLRLQ